MNDINIFLANNYIWFAYFSLFILFVLIIYVIVYKIRHRKVKPEDLETIKINDNKVEELIIDNNIQNNLSSGSEEVLITDNNASVDESNDLKENISNESTFNQ